MFKKQKENLKKKIEYAKIDITQAAKKKIHDVIDDAPPVHYDYSNQEQIKFNVANLDKKKMLSLAKLNPEYDKAKPDGKHENRVYKYKFPRQPVMVFSDDGKLAVSLCGQKIGYVPDEIAQTVNDILESGKARYIDAYAFGIDYKLIRKDKMTIIDNDLNCSIRIKHE